MVPCMYIGHHWQSSDIHNKILIILIIHEAVLYCICDSRGSNFEIFLSYLIKYWWQGRKSIHFLTGNDTRNTHIVTDCCNNQEFFRESQKRILIYCLEKLEQSIEVTVMHLLGSCAFTLECSYSYYVVVAVWCLMSHVIETSVYNTHPPHSNSPAACRKSFWYQI